jgi:hypothetical protein
MFMTGALVWRVHKLSKELNECLLEGRLLAIICWMVGQQRNRRLAVFWCQDT